MANENLGNSQEKASRRPEINRIKELVKVANNTTLHEDPDFPIMDPGYKDVVRSFGLQGIETVDDLFNRTEAPNYDPAKAKEALYVMATAVYETMIEEGQEELVVAGSFSVEKYLPHEFVGSDKNKPEESRFASVVVQNYIDKFGSEEKRNEISSSLEYLDYIKNSEYNQGNLLVEQAEEAYANLKKIKPNVMDKSEMDAYIKAVDYVSRLKRKKTVDIDSNENTGEKLDPRMLMKAGSLSGESSMPNNEVMAYTAWKEIPSLSETTEEAVMNWATQAIDQLGREQLFFSGVGWQQFGPYMEREVRSLFKSTGKSEKELGNAVEIIRAVVAPRMYEEVMFHSDGAIANVVNFLPKAGIFEVNEWNNDRKKILLKNPMVQYFYDQLYFDIQKQPLELLSKIKNPEMSNQMAEELRERVTVDKKHDYGYQNTDKRTLQGLARTAISVFVIDDMPNVIMWLNQRARSNPVERNVIIDGKVVKKTFFEVDGIDVNQRLEGRRINQDRIRNVVEVFDTKFNKYDAADQKEDAIMSYDNPLVGLRRPVDIYRVNNVWNEEVLKEMEQALWFTGDQVFVSEGKPVDLITHREKEGPGVKRFKSWSKINLKTLERWDSMISGFFGGTQGGDLDDFSKLEEGFDKLQKLIQNKENMENIGGAIAAKVIKAKTMALLSESRGGFNNNLIRALALERSSIPREISDALGKVMGSGMDADFGVIKELVSRLGFNFIGSNDMIQALNMMITETRDPQKAGKNIKIKKAAMYLKAIVDISGESTGTIKRK